MSILQTIDRYLTLATIPNNYWHNPTTKQTIDVKSSNHSAYFALRGSLLPDDLKKKIAEFLNYPSYTKLLADYAKPKLKDKLDFDMQAIAYEDLSQDVIEQACNLGWVRIHYDYPELNAQGFFDKIYQTIKSLPFESLHAELPDRSKSFIISDLNKIKIYLKTGNHIGLTSFTYDR